MDVDMVFTYVNGNDPIYIKKKNIYMKNEKASIKSNPSIRSRGIDEITYSVRSVVKFIPWIRYIFIVTDNQKPPVDEHLIKSKKVIIIDHKQIIDKKYLPTFNSNVIESHLHKIPKISQVFLYNNDDCMHLNYVRRDDIYIEEKGKVKLKLRSNFNLNQFSQYKSDYAIRLTKTAQYFLKNFPKMKFVNNHHTKILRRKTLEIIEEKEKLLLNQLRQHKFRSDEYINYIFFAVNLDCLLNQNIVIKDFKDVKECHLWTTNFKPDIFNTILKAKPKFLCMNSMTPSFKKGFIEFMERVLKDNYESFNASITNVPKKNKKLVSIKNNENEKNEESEEIPVLECAEDYSKEIENVNLITSNNDEIKVYEITEIGPVEMEKPTVMGTIYNMFFDPL